MGHLLDIKSLPSPHGFRVKAHHTCTSVLKIKDLLHAFIFKHAGRASRALGNAKSMLTDLLNKKTSLIAKYSMKLGRRKKKKPCTSSIRMHFNLLPMSEMSIVEAFDTSFVYYDSSWNAIIPTEQYRTGEGEEAPPVAGYLEWLEEKDAGTSEEGYENGNEFDRLAEKFIASCHERFMLEKQESYRRYQEMLARSL